MPQKTNVPFYAKFAAGKANCGVTSGWSCKVINEATDVVTTITNPVTEIIETINSPRTAVVTNNTSAGSHSILVNAGFTLQVGDTFRDSLNNVYYIIRIDGNTLYLAEGTVSDLSANSNLLQTGHTGIYKVRITITTVGNYIVFISNPAISAFNVFTTVEILPFNATDMNYKLDTIIASISGSTNIRFLFNLVDFFKYIKYNKIKVMQNARSVQGK